MSAGVRDIARITGFSVATVSRVLNNSSLVSPATRQAVLQAAETLNYRPNAAAKALSTRRTHIIGAVIPGIENSIFARFIKTLETQLALSGYALVLALTANNIEQETARARDLLNMGAEGLVLSGLEHDQDLIAFINTRKIPLICTSIFDAKATIPTIGYDNRALAYEAAQYLRQLGHQHIAVIHGPRDNNDRTRLRIAGVLDALNEDVICLETGLSVQGGASAAQQMLNRHPSCSAALCLSDVLAQGVMFEAARRKIDIPGDISVMGFDDLDWAVCAEPPLTTIHLPVDEMGISVADALAGFLDDARPIQSKRLDSRIIERASTAKKT